jgi:polyribonucleotide nucleotidyltransferase
LKRLNLLTNTSQISAQLRLQAAFGKKEVHLDGEEDEAIHAKVKAASYDKIYAVAKAGSAKHERSAFAEIKS